MRKVLCGFIGAFGISTSVWAIDLLEAYHLAIQSDPTYQAARSTAEAAREAIPQARAGLLPVVAYSDTRSRNSTEQTTQTTVGPRTSEYDYDGKSQVLSIRQPILRADRVVQLIQANAQVAAAEATLKKETQNLALRVSQSYFDVLLARDRLAAILAQKNAYTAQLALAEKTLLAGEGTRIDIDEARSRLLLANAHQIEAESTQFQMERTLAAVIGRPVKAEQLAFLDDSRLKFAESDGQSLEEWLSRAELINPELLALQHNLESAQAEVSRTRAQHLPTLDLFAQKSISDNESNTSVGSAYRTNTVGVQLSIPIFSGGQVVSATRQSIANLERVRQQLEAARNQLGIEITKQFDAYFRGATKVKAYEEARSAARQVLTSTVKGLQAGTRNTVDVLNAEQQLGNAFFDLSRAKIDFSLARLRLMAAAGELDESVIAQVNAWLVEPK